ncbi:MAG: DUF1801 domain-containing protein [Alphaproteobacteria bacterium]|nr:DUF1801 domain-containing protein [Alphaproteobacteria bacterium]
MSKADIEKINAYLEKLPDEQRTALEHVRALVKQVAPQAEEALVYGVPGFKQDGGLVCYAAFKAHCGFYPMSPIVLDAMKAELAGFETAKGTIRFTPEKPIPDALIAAIVRRRIEENATAVAVRHAARRVTTA